MTLRNALLLPAFAAGLCAAEPPRLDLARERTLFVVNYSHLDTQWRWAYPLVVRRMLRDTLYDNFAYMDRWPDYVFSWTGAGRYQLFQEYYPAEYQKLKGYVARGQWWPSGNAWEESDVNVPSSESLFRQLLVGHRFFKREFGTESADFMLPDCFGFPASLPSILAHAGLQGFSTQKLTWGSANGIPFNVGRWIGPDGKGIVAAFNPGAYDAKLTQPLTGEAWAKRLDDNGTRLGIRADMLYNGTGDEGGAPMPESMATLRAALAAQGPVKVVAGTADLLFKSLTPAQKERLPAYQGDLLLTEHSAGSITSQAFLKLLNRQGELLADAAEKAAAAAALLGADRYPAELLQKAWGLVLRNQFHDTLPGTSIPKAYEYAWNDGILAVRAFEGAQADAVAALSRGLDTRVEGTPLVVFNPLGIAREDVVEALVPAELAGAEALCAVDGGGRTLPTQRTLGPDGRPRVLFLAKVPAVGFAVFGLRAGAAPARPALKVTASGLENGRYRAGLDAAGDLASLFDKALGRELLGGPARLAFQQEKPHYWPAWNMDWKDRQKPPRGFVAGPAEARVVESGPVRVAVEVVRESEGSRFVQVYRLAAGSDRLEVVNRIDWKSAEACLKASFPFAAGNPLATYSWDLGTVQRGNNDPKKYEVPSHGWIDLTDASGSHGVTLLTGAKYGSDKPDDRTLRLTLLYSPGISSDYQEQRWQDWGRHAFTYGLMGHAGDWRQAAAPWQALRQDQPLAAFAVPRHEGALGRSFSLVALSSPQVAIQAFKRAEDGDGYVVRLQELHGRPVAGVRLDLAGGVAGAEDLDGLERPLGKVDPVLGGLRLDFSPYQVRTLGLKAAAPPRVAAAQGTPLPLPFDADAFSGHEDRMDGSLDGSYRSLPAEMIGDALTVGGLPFRLGPRTPGARNAVACQGQTLELPEGTRRVHLLAAATEDGVQATFTAGASPQALAVPAWTGYLGSWDNRVFKGRVEELTYSVKNPLERIAPAFLRDGRPAWWSSHHHAKGEDAIYAYAYLFQVVVEVPSGARTLTLPADARVKVFAATAARQDNADIRPLARLLPDLDRDPAFKARFDFTAGAPK